MDTLFGRKSFSMKALTDFTNLNKSARTHLKNVYSSLAITMLAAGVGGLLYITTAFQGLFLAAIGSIVTLIGLGVTQHNQENMRMRLIMLVGFGFFSGTSMGPLLEAVGGINPSIIPTAFIGTCVIFVCLTMAALYSEQRAFLFLGGTLLSGLFLLLFVGVFSFILPISFTYTIQVYLGLLIFCGLVLFDTQMIIEKHSCGDNDYIWHSVDLFIDFVAIFKRLLVILANKEKKKE